MRRIAIICILLLTTSFILGACARPTGAPEPVPTSNVNTYSKWGFSFKYPKEYSLIAMGLLESQATDASGIVQVSLQNDELWLFQIAWMGMVPSMFEISGGLPFLLEGSIRALEASEDLARVDYGEPIETTKAGHQMLYQHYTATSNDGKRIWGIIGVYYCDETAKFFQFSSSNDTTDDEHHIFEDFQSYLDSFVCH